MAQVHKAKLKSGEEVAVKILRPNIKRLKPPPHVVDSTNQAISLLWKEI
jgi:hypothetical protein